MTSERVPIAFIGNEMPPYRRYLLECLATGLPGVALHCLFTHDPAAMSMPWQQGTEDSPISPVYFDEAIRSHDRREPAREKRLAQRIVSYVTEHRIKLIILHGYNDHCRKALIRWAHQHDLPLLIRGDSNVLADGRLPAWKLFAKRVMLRPMLRSSAGTISMGLAGRAFFRLYADHDKPNFYLPCYPDLAAVRSATANPPTDWMQQHGLDPQRKRFLYSGRLVPHKAVDRIFDAFAEIANDRREWDVLICGDGPQRAALETNLASDLRSRVKWLGFQQFDGVCNAYAASHALVHASTFEPWGIVITEAMAAGLPIVSTSVTGAAFELVEDGVNGRLVEPGDHRSLVQVMLECTDDSVRRAWSSASRDAVDGWRERMHPARRVADLLAYFGLLDASV